MTEFKGIEKFMLSNIVAEHGKKSLGFDEDLLEQGAMDSLGLMKLIVFLEETYKLSIDDEDVIPENFQSLRSMTMFVQQKLQNQ